MIDRRRCYGVLTGAALAAALTTACGAPKATPIEGDVSSAIERGIARGVGTFDHEAWDEILRRHAEQDGHRFDYAGLKPEQARLESYLTRIAAADLGGLGSEELEALFINAYNAYTVYTILTRVTDDGSYEIESILDIPDVFGRERHTVGGYELSLDNMEHNILRPIFKDPRLHFAVNCASISCPPLLTRAFRGVTIGDDLEEAARKTLTNPDYVSLEGNELVITKIMEWYGDDFVSPEFHGSEKTLPLYIAKYATDEVRQAIETEGDSMKVRFRDYDWSLNKPRDAT